jgi:hypothetical protein
MTSDLQAYIKHKLSTNSAWAIRGLLKIYSLQTFDEQLNDNTRHENGVGFSGCDANILSNFAKQINNGRDLTQKQMNIVFKCMPRYHGQIVNFISSEKVDELKRLAAEWVQSRK